MMEAVAVSVSEAAKALSWDKTSIYALINEGLREVFKLGRWTLVKTHSIRRPLGEA